MRTDCESNSDTRGVCATYNALSIVTGGPTALAADVTALAVGATWHIKQLESSFARCWCIGAANDATISATRHSNDSARVT